jgi:predicted NAD/FAD-binding protein
VAYRFVGLVGLPRVRRAHHIDVVGVGLVGLDVALELMDERAVWLFGIGERLGSVGLRHTANYADAGTITQLPPYAGRRGRAHSPK